MNATTTFSWQANLLDASLTARSARSIAAPILPALLAGLLLAGVIGFTQSTRSALHDLRNRAELAERRLQDNERRLSVTSGESLEARRQATAAIEAELAARQQMLRSLQSSLASDTTSWSISGVLGTLSEHHREGLWLTRISIDRLRHDLALEGRAADAQQVSGYVAGLGKGASTLSKLSIRQIEGDRDEAPAGDAAAAAAPRTIRFKLQAQGGKS